MVDLDQLAAAQVRLETLAGSVGAVLGVTEVLDQSLPLVGTTSMVAAMGRVSVEWLRVVEEIADSLGQLAESVMAAMVVYSATDDLVIRQ